MQGYSTDPTNFGAAYISGCEEGDLLVYHNAGAFTGYPELFLFQIKDCYLHSFEIEPGSVIHIVGFGKRELALEDNCRFPTVAEYDTYRNYKVV